MSGLVRDFRCWLSLRFVRAAWRVLPLGHIAWDELFRAELCLEYPELMKQIKTR